MKRQWKENASWPEGHRGCKKCGKVKLFSEFHKHSQCSGGYNSICKECRLPISKQKWQELDYKQKIFNRAKGRAGRKGREFSISIEDVIIPELCPIFKQPLKENTEMAPSIDRIDSSKGYVKGNIQIISKRANLLKNNASIEELESVLKFLKEKV
jgi:UDP-N-acetylenolpyruvoylglucosamine reductase